MFQFQFIVVANKVKTFQDDYRIQVRETGKFALTMFRNCSLCKYLEFYGGSV